MKNILSTSLILILIVSLSCKKKNDAIDKTTPTNTNGGNSTSDPKNSGLHWQFNHLFEGDSFSLNTDFTDGYGNLIQFSRATFYLSQPKLYTDSKTEISTYNDYFIVHHNTSTLFIDSMTNTATIDSISINIGVDGLKNHEDPSLYDLELPLAFQSPSMHWGWTNGYLFIVIEGLVDTDNDNVLDDSFAFHIGSDSFLSLLKSNSELGIVGNNSNLSYINLDINYDKLFTGIDLSGDNVTHTMDNIPLANAFKNNIQSAFLIR